MPNPHRVRHLAPWFAGLAAVVVLISFEPRESSERSPAAERTRSAAAAQSGQRLREGDRQVQHSTFIEVDSEDHADGRRDDPRYALAWHTQQQRIIERQYGHAVASLNLPDSEAERLLGLLTARREAVADASDIAQRLGIVGPEAKTAVKQLVDALTDEIKQLVGADAYSAQIELAPTISTCEAQLADGVGLDLATRGDPLTADQLYSLAKDYVSAIDSPAASAGPQNPDPSTGLAPQYLDFLVRASSKVTAAQLSAISAFLLRQTQAARESGPSSPGS